MHAVPGGKEEILLKSFGNFSKEAVYKILSLRIQFQLIGDSRSSEI